jgi:hypothetical protein
MFAKVSILVLSILLVSFVLLSGCVGVNPIPGDVPNNGSDITGTLSDPNASPEAVLEALANAQKLGKDTPEMDEQTKAFFKKWINDILINPNATPEMLLNALAVAQMMGVDSEDMYNTVLAKLKEKINSELQSQSLCKDRLLEIAAYAQQLGFTQLGEEIIARASGMPNECGNTTVEYSEIVDSKGYSKTANATFRGTSMKLFAPGGFTMPDNKFYNLDKGSVNWNYYEFSDGGCIELYKKSSGTELMNSFLATMTKDPKNTNVAMGSLGRNNDDEYSGNFSITFDVTVREVKKQFIPSYPEEKDPCADVKAKSSYTEKGGITANFTGTSDESKIVDTKREEYKEEDYSSDTIIIWNLTLEN